MNTPAPEIGTSFGFATHTPETIAPPPVDLLALLAPAPRVAPEVIAEQALTLVVAWSKGDASEIDDFLMRHAVATARRLHSLAIEATHTPLEPAP